MNEEEEVEENKKRKTKKKKTTTMKEETESITKTTTKKKDNSSKNRYKKENKEDENYRQEHEEGLAADEEQLQKADDVLRYLVWDLPCPPRVSKTVILPNVSRDQLRRVVGQCFCLLVGCLTSKQHASVSQGRICLDNFDVLPH